MHNVAAFVELFKGREFIDMPFVRLYAKEKQAVSLDCVLHSSLCQLAVFYWKSDQGHPVNII